jgi:PAS domain-containing protein
MKKLALFIHGLGGGPDSTWKKFPGLIRADKRLAELYDVGTFEYSTGIIGSRPPLAICAAGLRTEIERRYPGYSDIALIAHSQGGLVGRYYIAETLNGGRPLRVSRLLTFATPHQGSWYAGLLKRFASRQVEDLEPDSQFLHALGVAWGQAKADRRVLTEYVVAADDGWVGPVSAMGPWSPGYQVIGNVGHGSIVKPETADSTSFLVAKRFLLEDGIQPGGVEADYRAPLLRFNRVVPTPITRFVYGARMLPLFGREAEIDILTGFLAGPEQPFRWMVMHGSGGVGKSRLALELCLALRHEWHAGFLPRDGQEPDWGRWQPMSPTLIVIDYAARDTDRIGRIIRALAGRCAADGTMRLAAPIRVLLIERTGEGDWLERIVGVGTAKAQVNADRNPDLKLATISDPWPIFEFIFGNAKKLLPDRAETLAALGEIDRERRALFAYFVADALVAGRNVRHFDAARLLDDVIDRERQAFWKPAGATAKEERLLAFATMVGGLPIGALADMTEKLLPSWDVDRHPAIFLAMTGRESGEAIAPLEPDIVGEHFALACLGQGNLSNEDRARLCALAWRMNPLSMGQFMVLAHRDLADHAMLCWVRKPPLSHGPPQLAWSAAAVHLMISFRPRDRAQALLDDMHEVAALGDEAQLWLEWSRAAYILTLHTDDLAAARSLLESKRRVAVQFGHDYLWESWASASYHVISSRLRFHDDPATARTMLNDVRALAAQREEAEVWKWWAMAAAVLVEYLGECDLASARALLDDIYGVAAQRDEALLWREWTEGARRLINRSESPVEFRAALDEMRRVAARCDEALIWQKWAEAAFVLMGYTANPAATRALLDDIRGVATRRDEAPLWEAWARAALQLTGFLESSNPPAARALLAEVLALPYSEILHRQEPKLEYLRQRYGL